MRSIKQIIVVITIFPIISGETKKDTNVCMHAASKRIALENPGCSGFLDF